MHQLAIEKSIQQTGFVESTNRLYMHTQRHCRPFIYMRLAECLFRLPFFVV